LGLFGIFPASLTVQLVRLRVPVFSRPRLETLLGSLGLRPAGHSPELARSSLLLVGNTLLAAGFGFFFWLAAARSADPSALGAAAALITMLPWVATLAGLGLPEMLLRFLADNTHPRAFLRRLTFSVAVSSVVSGLLWWVSLRGTASVRAVSDGWELLPLLCVLVLAVTANSLSTAALIASRRSGLVLFETAAAGVARLLVVLWFPTGSAFLLLCAALAASVLASVVSFVLAFSVALPADAPGAARPVSPDVRRFSYANWATSLASLAPRALVVSIVSWRAGVEAAAWVAVPLMMYPFLVLIPSASFRALLASASATPAAFPRLARQMLQFSVLCTSLAAAVAAAAAPLVLSVFGARYEQESASLLRLLALAALVAVPNYVLDAALYVRRDRRGVLTVGLLGSLWILFSVFVAAAFAPVGIGYGWLVGQIGYSAIAVSVVFRRSGSHFGVDFTALARAAHYLRGLPPAPRPRSSASSANFVMILTYGRTGSTVLQAVLNAHDGVHVRGENSNLAVSLFRATAAARATSAHATPVPLPSNAPWFGAGLLNVDGLLEKCRAIVRDDVLAVPDDAALFGFKEVRHTPSHFASFGEFAAYVAFLDELFPGARFVCNVRSLADTAASGWWASDPDAPAKLAVAREWIERLPAATEHGLPPDRFLLLDYDRWSDDPSELLPLLEFLDLPPDIDLLRRVLGVRLSHMQAPPRT